MHIELSPMERKISVANNQNANMKKVVANLFRARFPFLYISTWEEERVLSFIRSIASDISLIKTSREVITWKLTTGLVINGKPLHDTKNPMKALEFIENYEEPSVFVLHDFHIYFGEQNRCPDFQIIRKLRDMAVNIKQSIYPKNIVFISPILLLPVELQKDITIIDFELPTFEEIMGILDEMIDVNKQNGRITINLKENEKEKLAKAALGLTLSEAENAFARAMVEDGQLDVDDVEVILKEKEQIIKKTGILEFIHSDFSMDDVGGLENLKRWLKKRNKSWLESAQRYGLPSPKGVLITGVPGCGKSLISKAISAMWQLPLLRLDIGKIFSGVVGSSEENMRKAIKTAEAIAPSILWIDEIEKGFSGVQSTGDSGTTSRVFGHFLTWMQEKMKPVFVVATANNISSLPSEFLRKGRFDEVFFVDLPTYRERVEIFRVHLNKRLKDPRATGTFTVSEEILNKLASLTEGFIGAEIEQIVIDGLFEAFFEERSVTFEDFEKACKKIVPLSVTQAEQIQKIREWANVRAVTATPREDLEEYVASDSNSHDNICRLRGGRTIDF
ncbi:AAA family ATPase [Anoxybacillus sp. ST70]|uniref:AAA family ATPase n=1 Tax=Anoxybacillus sp. ST70 TaxID=2864180 RepID=UPI0021081B57|nr:AAA family ATPase [Anoxybacillus sp. ST70]